MHTLISMLLEFANSRCSCSGERRSRPLARVLNTPNTDSAPPELTNVIATTSLDKPLQEPDLAYLAMLQGLLTFAPYMELEGE